MTYTLECHNLSKAYGRQQVLNNVSLSARSGQIVALLGPSGGGKTTTLRLIAGFDWPDNGRIIINGRVVASENVRIPPEDRRIGMVFQEYALFPHLDVAGNIGFGLNGTRQQQRERIAEMLALVGLVDYAQRMPYELSGGQQQRIALARALAPAPDIVLLDEPFSNLDTALRAGVRAEVRSILKQSVTTCIFVTHDQEEALSLADEVAVMLDGSVAQMADPQILYRFPASREVAAFVGETNFLPGEAAGDSVTCALGRLPLAQAAYGAVEVLLRPEALLLRPEADTPGGEITWREFYGHDQRLGVRLDDGTTLIARADSEQVLNPGLRVGVVVANPVQVFPR